MKAYIFLANGFEILETLSPVDVLKRCGAEIKIVSVEDNLLVASSQNNYVKADVHINDVNFDDGDLLIVPGGYPGYVNLRENKRVVDIVKKYIDGDKYVAAICGGPTIFALNKLALGKTLTAHSSTKDLFRDTYNYTGKNIEIDGKIITGIGAGHSIGFSFLIAEQFFSKEIIEKVKNGMEIDYL